MELGEPSQNPLEAGGPLTENEAMERRVYAETKAMRKIWKALEPLSPEKRARVFKAVCILYGFDDLAGAIRW